MGQFIDLVAATGYLKSVGKFHATVQDGVTQAEVDVEETKAESRVRQRLAGLYSRVFEIDAELDVDALLDELDVRGHGLALNDKVRLRSNVTMPAPLVAGTVYYAIPVDKDTIRLAATANGGAIDLTAEGEGDLVIERALWTTAAETPTTVRDAAELLASAAVLQISYSRAAKKEKGVAEAAKKFEESGEARIEECEAAPFLVLDDGSAQMKLGTGAPTCASEV